MPLPAQQSWGPTPVATVAVTFATKCLLESKNKCLTTTDDHAKFSLIGQHSATSELTVTVQVAMIVRVSAESL